MRISQFELRLNKNADAGFHYLAGEEMRGSLELQVRKATRIAQLSIRLLGQTSTAWVNKVNDVFYEGTELVVDEFLDLTAELTKLCREDRLLPEGRHQVCFKMQIPKYALSSIDNENFGSIGYLCSAVLDLPEAKRARFSSDKRLVIHSVVDLDTPYFLQAVKARNEAKISGCCRKPEGLVRADLTVGQLGVVPGEIVKISTTIENTVRRTEKSRRDAVLSLCQQMDFRAHSRYEFEFVDEKSQIITVQSQTINRQNTGSEHEGPETQTFAFRIPPGLPPSSTKPDTLITCRYFFRLDLDYIDVIVPVILGSVKKLKI